VSKVLPPALVVTDRAFICYFLACVQGESRRRWVRVELRKGVTETQQLAPLQWQLMMKSQKRILRSGRQSWWGPASCGIGSILFWLKRLRELNGLRFTWPLLVSADPLPERPMASMGKICFCGTADSAIAISPPVPGITTLVCRSTDGGSETRTQSAGMARFRNRPGGGCSAAQRVPRAGDAGRPSGISITRH